MTIVKEKMVVVLYRVGTVGTGERYIDAFVNKGGPSGWALVVDKPKKKLKFIGNFYFPDPIQAKVGSGKAGSLGQKVVIGRTASKFSIANEDPSWGVRVDEMIGKKSVLDPSLYILRNKEKQGIQVQGAILPVRDQLHRVGGTGKKTLDNGGDKRK